MSPGGARVIALVLAGLALAGCTLNSPNARRGGMGPPSDRILLLARTPTAENRPIADSAADLLAAALRDASVVMGARDFIREAAAVRPPMWGPRLVERLQDGAWPTAEESAELLSRLGISAILTVEVTTFDQVWGRYAKFTRVGVGVQGFHVASGSVVWRAYRDIEVEDKRGRSFQWGMEQAVWDLAQAIEGQSRLTAGELWRYWRR